MTVEEQDKLNRPKLRQRKSLSPEAEVHRATKVLESCIRKLRPYGLFSKKVQAKIDEASRYVDGAELKDGAELLSVQFVPTEQVGALPALHARWQKGTILDGLTEDESKALSAKGFSVIDDRDDTNLWCYCREKKISHAWIILNNEGWKWSRARSVVSANWEMITDRQNPLVPSLPGCPHNHRTEQRDSMIEALTWLKEGKLPDKVHLSGEFLSTMISLWKCAVKHSESKHSIQQAAN